LGLWGLGFGGLAPIPNPQSPIPNPQSPKIYNIPYNIILIDLIFIIKEKI